jgi:hypothetical protein
MPKDENFGLQRGARQEQAGGGVPDQLEEIPHRSDLSTDSWVIDGRFAFTVKTLIPERFACKRSKSFCGA